MTLVVVFVESGHCQYLYLIVSGVSKVPHATSVFDFFLLFLYTDDVAVFDASGVDLGQPVVASCQTAMTACGLAAAAHLLGKEIVPVYNVGSFCLSCHVGSVCLSCR